ncbi:MAG: aldehyde ferredoxin oxidoreductase C-terminal domain-containing protein [Bacillota bacterium]|nr:aldehyde ferredoxin oxidoreductase C-terminal domain-containing protein [Bacillota bacterium]
MRKLVRVNMTEKTVRVEELPEKYCFCGGRWLTSTLVADEVPPTCHPLGPNNRLVFAPGIVTGTAAPSSGRISVGGKSPLTGGIKEANAGTPVAQSLARMGIAAVVVEGEPREKRAFFILRLNKDGGELEPAGDLAGLGLYEFAARARQRFGEAGFVVTGPCGEQRMAMAGVCFNDGEFRPSRYAGRGGLGAVMGAKGLKAIVVDDAGAPGVALANEELFHTGRQKLADALREHAVTKPGGALNSFGTAVLINILNEAGGLPTRNFSAGRFEGAGKIAGETIAETIGQRGGRGKTGHGCHPGCVIQCSNIWSRPDGSEHVSCLEYESVWALGANCGIDDLDAIAELIWVCNDSGLDTIEAGVTLAVAMEAGLIPFGNGRAAIDLLRECARGTPLGRILGNGAAFTGRAFGVTRVPVAKGQGMPAYEPRAVKGIGVTYLTSPMGADHTAGYTIAPEILSVGGKADPLLAEGKVEISANLQAATAFVDSTGYCLFIAFAILDIPSGFEGVVETCNGVLGTTWSTADAAATGAQIVLEERRFNQEAGLTRAHDRPPEFMRYELLPPHNRVYDVPDEELDRVAVLLEKSR